MNWYQEVRKAYQQGKILKANEIANLIFADEARDGKVIMNKEIIKEGNILQVGCKFIPNTGSAEELVIYFIDISQDFSKKVVFKKKYIKEEKYELASKIYDL